MTKKEQLELQFAKKKYDVLPDNKNIVETVRYLESVLQQKMDVWSDEQEYEKFQKINKLNLSDRRLMLVFSILDGSIAKTATAFGVNRKTILSNIERIKNEMNL